MKKKKKKFSKKTKLIIIVVLIFIIILCILLGIKNSKVPENLDEVSSLQEMVEYCECRFISYKESEEDGFFLDIYLEFKYSPYEEEQSKQSYYDVVISGIANYMQYQNFRLIDESKGLTIGVECYNGAIYTKTINGLEESDYFNKLLSEQNKNEQINLKEIDVTLNYELSLLLQNNWNTRNVSFGTKTSTFRNYDIYFESGYRVRSIYNTLFNLVFTDKYQNSVINDIRVGDSLDSIKEKLGDNYIQNGSILEYITKDMYICFSETEISIYPKITYDYTSFEELLETYNDKKDFLTFMNRLTDIWPDYSYYVYNESYCEIWYPLKGVKISNSNSSQNGIQIYQEYRGNLINEYKEYYQLYYKTNESLILEQEKSRRLIKAEYVNSTNGSYSSSKYVMRADYNENGEINNIAFFSIDGTSADSELSKDIFANKTYWYDDDNYIYSISNEGIYVYNATTRTTNILSEDEGNYDVTNFDFDTKVITYDGKEVKIEL